MTKWIANPRNRTELLCSGYDDNTESPTVGADFYWTYEMTEAIKACKLASAAPDLLEALKLMLGCQEAADAKLIGEYKSAPCSWSAAVKEAKAAIAKAEEEES